MYLKNILAYFLFFTLWVGAAERFEITKEYAKEDDSTAEPHPQIEYRNLRQKKINSVKSNCMNLLLQFQENLHTINDTYKKTSRKHKAIAHEIQKTYTELEEYSKNYFNYDEHFNIGYRGPELQLLVAKVGTQKMMKLILDKQEGYRTEKNKLLIQLGCNEGSAPRTQYNKDILLLNKQIINTLDLATRLIGNAETTELLTEHCIQKNIMIPHTLAEHEEGDASENVIADALDSRAIKTAKILYEHFLYNNPHTENARKKSHFKECERLVDIAINKQRKGFFQALLNNALPVIPTGLTTAAVTTVSTTTPTKNIEQ